MTPKLERLQKVIAASGFCSRRQAEEHIQMGKVTVNGKKVTEMGTKVDADRDQIAIGGQSIAPVKIESHQTIILYKPRNYLVTRRDVRGRPTIYDLLPKDTTLLPVGRLDFDSEGLLILTTDRALIHRLTHPKFEIPRMYEVKIQGQLTSEMIKTIEAGLEIDMTPKELLSPDGKKIEQAATRLAKSGSAKIKILKQNPHNSWVTITLKEGKNREVRRIFEAVDRPVLRLKRVAYGSIELGDLDSGQTRPLSPRQLAGLLKD